MGTFTYWLIGPVLGVAFLGFSGRNSTCRRQGGRGPERAAGPAGSSIGTCHHEHTRVVRSSAQSAATQCSYCPDGDLTRCSPADGAVAAAPVRNEKGCGMWLWWVMGCDSSASGNRRGA